MLSALPLKGLSNDDAEALRVCMAVQPARATGIWWAVHDRATARALLARAGIVDAGVRVGCEMGDVVEFEDLAGQELLSIISFGKS